MVICAHSTSCSKQPSQISFSERVKPKYGNAFNVYNASRISVDERERERRRERANCTKAKCITIITMNHASVIMRLLMIGSRAALLLLESLSLSLSLHLPFIFHLWLLFLLSQAMFCRYRYYCCLVSLVLSIICNDSILRMQSTSQFSKRYVCASTFWNSIVFIVSHIFASDYCLGYQQIPHWFSC